MPGKESYFLFYLKISSLWRLWLHNFQYKSLNYILGLQPPVYIYTHTHLDWYLAHSEGCCVNKVGEEWSGKHPRQAHLDYYPLTVYLPNCCVYLNHVPVSLELKSLHWLLSFLNFGAKKYLNMVFHISFVSIFRIPC